MSANNNKFVPIGELIDSNEFMKIVNELRGKTSSKSSKNNIELNHKLTQEHLGAEANFGCAMHRFIALNEMRSDWSGDGFEQSDFDQIYDEYHDYVLAAARHVKAYRAHKKTLQQAVTKQGKKRKF